MAILKIIAIIKAFSILNILILIINVLIIIILILITIFIKVDFKFYLN